MNRRDETFKTLSWHVYGYVNAYKDYQIVFMVCSALV